MADSKADIIFGGCIDWLHCFLCCGVAWNVHQGRNKTSSFGNCMETVLSENFVSNTSKKIQQNDRRQCSIFDGIFISVVLIIMAYSLEIH